MPALNSTSASIAGERVGTNKPTGKLLYGFDHVVQSIWDILTTRLDDEPPRGGFFVVRAFVRVSRPRDRRHRRSRREHQEFLQKYEVIRASGDQVVVTRTVLLGLHHDARHRPRQQNLRDTSRRLRLPLRDGHVAGRPECGALLAARHAGPLAGIPGARQKALDLAGLERRRASKAHHGPRNRPRAALSRRYLKGARRTQGREAGTSCVAPVDRGVWGRGILRSSSQTRLLCFRS
jgi:hypothetical protein